jgi:hypothetical protein
MGTGLEYCLIKIVPPFGLFSPKRSILIFKLRALAAENCHRTTVSNLVHIASIWLCAESWANKQYAGLLWATVPPPGATKYVSEPGGY